MSAAMTALELLTLHREAILALAVQHGARDVRVFGSVARGEEGARSDIDLLIRLDPGRTLLDLTGLSQGLEDLLGCKVDVVTEGGLYHRLRDRILAEARPV
jgi:hypothetical protein